MTRTRSPSPLPGLLLGLGFGGFIDGIVLHEILQWHHMISGSEPTDTVAGLELNVLADGFFHVGTWLLVMAGSILTVTEWRRGRLAPNWSFHLGLLLAGWGVFNLVEGLINHQLLGIHHVLAKFPTRRAGDEELYDLSVDPFELANRVDEPALDETRQRLADHARSWLDANRP